ncbi:MAG: L-2-amino-thiazoline-4-carboxylic acid hydrolase [Ruminiclostridium sp.]|nr:L-2-amino-thiazoline-4-carboxylic acid hydrolase [Ruminiclostridium sp.]
MNALDKQIMFKKMKKILIRKLGEAKGSEVWNDAAAEYDQILHRNPGLRKHKGAMAIPTVALYRAFRRHGIKAEETLKRYGAYMGRKIGKIAHEITSLPNVDRKLWANIEKIVDSASSEEKGYKRRIVSEPPEMYGVDILSCPFHEICKELGCERAVLCICSMDKVYMKNLHHFRYDRTTAVSDGAECCDYRIRFDPNTE